MYKYVGPGVHAHNACNNVDLNNIRLMARLMFDCTCTFTEKYLQATCKTWTPYPYLFTPNDNGHRTDGQRAPQLLRDVVVTHAVLSHDGELVSRHQPQEVVVHHALNRIAQATTAHTVKCNVQLVDM